MSNAENPQAGSDSPTQSLPPLISTTGTWAKIGVFSFGGPAAQIALMHRIIVEEKRWLEERQFLNALNFCMLLPGPEAMQLATYSGWRMHGVRGGLIAGGLFVVPGAVVMLCLATLYVSFGEIALVQAAFAGVKAAVFVIVIEALLRVSRRALDHPASYAIAAFAFVGIFFLTLPYPAIVLAAAIYGYVRTVIDNDPPLKPHTPGDNVTFMDTLKTVSIWLLVWWAPILLLYLAGGDTILDDIAVFFSKLAVVTFGGAYAVLAYMAQDVVDSYQWLEASEMVDGLGLAETTPGPLILVTEFVGFLAAAKSGGFWNGVAGAGITLWVTFVPCFLWIFAGAPYVERISAHPRLRNALAAITAAVVGVILNLSIWFALNVFFSSISTHWTGNVRLLIPDLASFEWQPLLLAILSAALLLLLRQGMAITLLAAAAGGVVLSLFS